MFQNIRSNHNDWIFRSALISSCKRRNDGTFVVFPKKSFLFGEGYLLTKEQVPVFEDWYRKALKTGASRLSMFTRLFRAAAIFIFLAGTFYLLSEPENAPDFIAAWVDAWIAAWPPIANILVIGGVVAVVLWIVALARKRAFDLTSKFAASFPFPDAPQMKLSLREQFAMPFRSAVATPGARWVMVLALILSGVMLPPLVMGISAAFLLLSMEQLSDEFFINLELLMLLVTAAVLMSLPALASISGLGYRRRFHKKTGHPLTMENLYLYETGRLPPGAETLNPKQVITVFGRQWSKPSLPRVLLTASAVALVAFVLVNTVPIVRDISALTSDGWRCINSKVASSEKLIRLCSVALEVVKDPGDRAELYLHRSASYQDTGKFDLAIADLSKAVELVRGNPIIHGQLAWLLATAPNARDRDGERAVEYARRALELLDDTYIDAHVHDILAAALAESGRFREAVERQNIAIDKMRAYEPSADLTGFEARLSLYLSKHPLRCPNEACN